MIYTHVLNRGPSGVTSPADRSRLPAEVAEAALQRLPLAKIVGRRVARPEHADARHLCRLLRLASERRESEADNDDDREPDPSRRHLGGDGWQESNKPPPCGRVRYPTRLTTANVAS